MPFVNKYLWLIKLGLLAVIAFAAYNYITHYKVLYLQEQNAKLLVQNKLDKLTTEHEALKVQYNELKTLNNTQNQAIDALNHDMSLLDQKLADANITIVKLKKTSKERVSKIMAGVDDKKDCPSSIRGSISRLKEE